MSATAHRSPPSISGVLRDIENVYYTSATGHILASPSVFASTKRIPFYGTVSISLDDVPITAKSAGRTYESHAIAFCGREVEFAAAAARFVAISVNPLHPNFRAFTRMKHPVLELDRRWFSHFEPLLHKALDGSLTHDQANALLDGVHALVRPRLPAVPRLNERAQILLRELWANPRCSVTELARRLGLSYHRTSHYFVEAVGIPVRTYQLWQKLYRVAPIVLSGASLTQAAHAAGFVDSAHLSSAYQNAYGRPPSELFRSQAVMIHSTDSVREARSAPDPSSNFQVLRSR